MLIVEGADLVGKTTLAKELARKLNEVHGMPHVYQHLGRLPACWRGRARQLHEDLARRWVVQDRFHMSEVMYSTARGDQPALSPREYEMLDCLLRSALGMVTVVLVDVTGETIKSRWREGEMYPLDKVLEVNRRYAELVAGAGTFKGRRMHLDHVLVADEAIDEEFRQQFIDDILLKYVEIQNDEP